MTTSRSGPNNPFDNEPLIHTFLWTVSFAVLVISGLIGWRNECLTEALWGVLAFYGTAWFVYGQVDDWDLREWLAAIKEDYQALRTSPLSSICGAAQSPHAGMLLRMAATLIQIRGEGGEVNVTELVDANLAKHQAKVEQRFQAAENAPKLGMAGTAAGLLLLFSGLDTGADLEEFNASINIAISGMVMAVSTTFIGVLLDLLLANEARKAEQTLNQIRSQLISQLNFLRLQVVDDDQKPKH